MSDSDCRQGDRGERILPGWPSRSRRTKSNANPKSRLANLSTAFDTDSMETPTRRPWWNYVRFSVRGLIALVLPAGGMLGWIVNQAHVQRDAAAAIRRANGNVEYDLDPSRSPGWLRWLADRFGIDFVSHVIRADLVGVGPDGPSTGAELDHVVHLKQIEQLELWESSINDARLADLKGLTRLRSLGLRKTRVTDTAVRELQRALPKLKISRLQPPPAAAVGILAPGARAFCPRRAAGDRLDSTTMVPATPDGCACR
jgi:hypothetical protein